MSATVSVLIFGVALANIPFGMAADHWPIKPLLLGGALVTIVALIWSARAQSIEELTAARFLGGLAIPALTTCLVTWLSQSQPPELLARTMGNYVAATVLGGYGGRLISGVLFTPEQWRLSLLTVAAMIGFCAALALWHMPSTAAPSITRKTYISLFELFKRPTLAPLFACGAAGLGLFATVFNFLPYRLAAAPFELPSHLSTVFYTTYMIGLLTAPLSGPLAARWGSSYRAMLVGALGIWAGLGLLLFDHLALTLTGLLVLSGSFFAMHAAAVGSVNAQLRLGEGRGRANALYTLSYYIGGSIGIQLGGYIYLWAGWQAVLGFAACLTIVPLTTALRGEAALNR